MTQPMDLATFTRISNAARKKRRREENVHKHATARRAPGWDETIHPEVVSVTEAAKRLGLRRKELFSWLDAHAWIVWIQGAQAWAARESAIEHGWLAVRRKTIGYQRHVHQVVVTPAGLGELAMHIPKQCHGKQR